jgi:hypothetical protein
MADDSSNYDNELYAKICKDLDDRQDWEGRQILWGKMRKHGVRRARKPWSGAADMHVPLGDTIISKLKAYYMQWVFGPELLASFYSMETQGDSYTDSVAQWFDYQVRECSNFVRVAMCAMDSTLQNGVGLIKTYWDGKKNRLSFANVHPYFVIIPPWTTTLQEADRVCHVMHMSEADYRRSGTECGYNMDDDFIDSIKGEGKPDNKYRESTYQAEGLSFTRLKDLIILWEVYNKLEDGNIEVQTFSPLAPDEPARATFKLPYDHHQVPIAALPYEWLDEMFFSSRGVMELVQMYEASATKMWNEKLDYMSVANRPVLSSQGGSVNAQNIRWEPGAVYDAILQLVQQPPPPVDFDQEVQNNKSLAEQRVGIPDFGIGQANTQDKSRTATEVNSITNVMQQSNDLRARISKDSITTVYEQAWSILKQYKKDSLDYFWRKRRIQLPDAALDNKYLLKPNGSVDGYSKDKEIQKLMQLRQLAQGSPWIVVPEIDRKIIELMDSSWIVDLYQPPPLVTNYQQEEQAIETAVMSDGFVPQAQTPDDHVIHCTMIEQYIQFQQPPPPQPPTPPTPPKAPIPNDFMQRLMQHGMMHVQLARQDPNYMRQHGQDIEAFAKKFQATVNQMQAQQMAQQKAATTMGNLRNPPGMPTMPGGPGPAPAPPMVPPPPAVGAASGNGAPPNPQNNGGPQ